MNLKLKAVCLSLTLIGSAGILWGQDAQSTRSNGTPPRGWHLLDKQADGFHGISLKQAYDFLQSKNLKGKEIIVAVIDSGIDTLHEDLKPVLWKNPGEIPGNGIDDDGNGYIDDVYGWNFLGGKDGRNVGTDSYEGARVYHRLKEKYGNSQFDPATLSEDEKFHYHEWLRAKEGIEGAEDMGVDMVMLKRAFLSAQKSDSTLQAGMKKAVFTGNELDSFQTSTPEERTAKNVLLYLLKANNQLEGTNKDFIEGFGDYLAGEERKAEAKTKAPKEYRKEIVGDDYYDINDRFYGNGDVMANTPFHGTHVSGIIAAVRGNKKGIDGVADNVKIMTIRAVPDGDEHDKDIALGIRYAVDNGARIINMSFGKSFSPEKHWVDEAVQYAHSKGVLLVHAAGNDGKNLDSSFNYPSPVFKKDRNRASNWITVGASGDPGNGGLTAVFSNYGKAEVDVFAPGVGIYSTIPGRTTYGNAQGTSMASPVVAGTAALVLSYFPYLTPEQVKYSIEQSTVAPENPVKTPGSGQPVQLSEISRSGGIVNAYEAVKIASTLKPDGKIPNKEKAPRPVMKNKKG